MRRAVTVGLLAIIFGCTEAQTKTYTVDPPSHEVTVPSSSAPIALSGSNSPTVAEYPETTEVERLLSRAAQLEADGTFQEALAIVDSPSSIHLADDAVIHCIPHKVRDLRHPTAPGSERDDCPPFTPLARDYLRETITEVGKL